MCREEGAVAWGLDTQIEMPKYRLEAQLKLVEQERDEAVKQAALLSENLESVTRLVGSTASKASVGAQEPISPDMNQTLSMVCSSTHPKPDAIFCAAFTEELFRHALDLQCIQSSPDRFLAS